MKAMKKWIGFLSIFILCLTFSAFTRRNVKKNDEMPKLLSINIIDRNGFSETISNPERLKQFQSVDFLKNQPYQKVLRIYSRKSNGDIASIITSYHENGQPKQYLECMNARAFGKYQEWHSNGNLSLCANVIGGVADIALGAEQSWVFNEINRAWDEEGNLVAEISYVNGELEGISYYYHSDGSIWKKIPYSKNEIDGVFEVYLENGQLLQATNFSNGIKHGESIRYWEGKKIAAKEEYINSLLAEGQYFDKEGKIVANIENGMGSRAIFGKNSICELHQYQNGIVEGEVKIYNKSGQLAKVYNVKNGRKHGLETDYYPSTLFTMNKQTPKLSVNWIEGKIQGIVKTWYPNGNTESQKEMSQNKKNGMFTAWYRDGNLMMIEEYEYDKLIKGDYFKKGEKQSISTVVEGKGVATLFDADGNFNQKVQYNLGKPIDG